MLKLAALRGSLLSLALMSWLSACADDAKSIVYLDLAYQVRCLDCVPYVAEGGPHNIHAVDGEEGYRLTCDVTRLDGVRSVSFSVLQPADDSGEKLSFSFEQVDLDSPTPAGSRCQVRLTQSGNTYEGACSADAPSVATPCQVSLSEQAGTISGQVLCQGIPNIAGLRAGVRHVVAPGTRDQPAALSIHGCSGL